MITSSDCERILKRYIRAVRFIVTRYFVHQEVWENLCWQGYVEVFVLTGHSQAKRCYGWCDPYRQEFVTVLDAPSGIDPKAAVKLATTRPRSLNPCHPWKAGVCFPQ
jgi:hypothetical protein